jgi:hypothetical protein
MPYAPRAASVRDAHAHGGGRGRARAHGGADADGRAGAGTRVGAGMREQPVPESCQIGCAVLRYLYGSLRHRLREQRRRGPLGFTLHEVWSYPFRRV